MGGYKEQTVRISLPKYHYIFIVSIQNIHCHIADLHLKTIMQGKSIDKHLEGCAIVGRIAKSTLIEYVPYCQVIARMKGKPKQKTSVIEFVLPSSVTRESKSSNRYYSADNVMHKLF